MIRRLTLTVLVVAALAPALRGDAAPPVLVQPGVTVAGIPVGGMSNEQAQAALRPAFARPVRLMYGNRRWKLYLRRFGARVTISDGVLQALGAQAGAAVPLVPAVNKQEVRRFVNELDKRISVPAVDAGLSRLKGLRPQFTRETAGVSVLRELTVRRIVRALQSPHVRRIHVAVKAVAPARTVAKFGPVIVTRRGVNQLRYYRAARLLRTFGVASVTRLHPHAHPRCGVALPSREARHTGRHHRRVSRTAPAERRQGKVRARSARAWPPIPRYAVAYAVGSATGCASTACFLVNGNAPAAPTA